MANLIPSEGSNSVLPKLLTTTKWKFGKGSIIRHQQPLSGGISAGNGVIATVDISEDPLELIDLMEDLNAISEISEFYTEGGSLLKEAVVGFISNTRALLGAFAQLIPINNEALSLRVELLKNRSSISELGVVKKINMNLSVLIAEIAALPNMSMIKENLETFEAKATELTDWLTISKRLRKVLSCVAAGLFGGGFIAVLSGSNVGFPEANVPLGMVITGIGLGTFNYTLWKNWNNVLVKKITLLKQMSHSNGILLAGMQTMENYAETGKTSSGELLLLDSPPVDAAQRKVLIVQILDSIKDHSDKLNECIQYTNHAAESVLKDAISYAA